MNSFLNLGGQPQQYGVGNPTSVTYNYGAPSGSIGPASGGGGWDSLLSGAIGAGASIYGSQNAAEAATKGNQAGIGTQQTTMGNIGSLYTPQTTLGNGAFNTLGSTLGTNGQPADYSNFLNMPGYQFAVQQGTQAIQRAAAANGSAYTPNTLNAVGQYVTGTAMQDYNTYVQQLMGAAGFGQSANQGLTSAFLNTGGNISQLQANTGQNQAGGYTGTAGAIGSFLGGGNGANLSGIVNGISSLFGSGNNSGGGSGGFGNFNFGGGGASFGTDPSTGQTYDPVSGNWSGGGGGGMDFSGAGAGNSFMNTDLNSSNLFSGSGPG